MGKSTGSADEDIGRPGAWREGRYQRPGKSVDESVTKEPPRSDDIAIVSTPVTREDYEQADKPRSPPDERRKPGA